MMLVQKGITRFPQQQKMAATKPLLLEVIEAADQYALAKNKPLPFYNIETKSQPATDNQYHPKSKRIC
jgi:glycerophosphoryl diester phosphodiesterase